MIAGQPSTGALSQPPVDAGGIASTLLRGLSASGIGISRCAWAGNRLPAVAVEDAVDVLGAVGLDRDAQETPHWCSGRMP